MALGWIIDPGSAQFDLNDLSSTFMVAQSLPMPQPRAQYVTAVDVDGDSLYSQNYGNRQITLTCEVKGASASAVETTLGYLHQKVAAINREAVASRTGIGGALQYTSPSGKTATFDVCSVSVSPDLSATYFLGNLVQVTLTFDCLPFWRGAEVTSLSTHTELTLPVLVFTETSIAGDVPALGNGTITEAQGVDQFWLVWGMRSRYYSSSADAKLFYEAEGRTALGGSATAIGATGASGAGSNVMRSASLSPSYLAILSTQATAAGNHLSHIGDYQVYARVQTPTANTGAVSLALEWAQGDFLRVTRNAAVTFPVDSWDGTWRLVNLGPVSLTKAVTGTQRWEGRLIASSTIPGDTVDVDYLMFIPITEGSGVVEGLTQSSAPTSFLARDEFNQAAGLLMLKTAPIGGVWDGAGAANANDFSVEATGHTAQRATAADAGNLIGRYALSGASAMTATAVKVDVKVAARDANTNIEMGVLARYFDTNNWVKAVLYLVGGPGVPNPRDELHIEKRVAGSYQVVSGSPITLTPVAVGSFYTIQLIITATGAWSAWVNGSKLAQGVDMDMATGGALASGKVGMYDVNVGASSPTRTYDNFAAWAPPADAAMFASRQLQLRYDRVIRQDSAGVVWATPSKYEGDYPMIPPSGREGRVVEMIVKACRYDPSSGPDSAIDDISAQLIYTPRGLSLPE